MFAGLRINGVQGILNGTSNYVLGRMEAGLSLHDAVAEAQELGYAEADPTADIEGSDVQLKVVILANEVLGADLTTADVERRGLSTVSAAEIAEARAQGPSLEAHRHGPSQRRRIGLRECRARRPAARPPARGHLGRRPTPSRSTPTCSARSPCRVPARAGSRPPTRCCPTSSPSTPRRGAAHRGWFGCLSSSSPPSRPACSPASPPCSTRTTAPRSAASRSTTPPTSTGSSSAPASASRSRVALSRYQRHAALERAAALAARALRHRGRPHRA